MAWQEVFVLAGPKILKVEFFNVGQGDSVFIQTSQGHQILIDGGPDSSILEKIAKEMPFWDRKIDVIILTHPEKDHMTGILEILQRYKADYFLWTGIEKQDAENKRLIELLKNSKKVLNVFSGEKIKAGGAEIDILYPFESLAGEKTESSVNNTSIVAKLIYGKDLFLFTGDISSKAETQLTNSAELVKADVLKVAHHGSKYSSSEEFLENVRPEYAVISVGKNTYGHPAPEVLQRLKKYDIKILRTDQNGDIKFISNGNGISNFFH